MMFAGHGGNAALGELSDFSTGFGGISGQPFAMTPFAVGPVMPPSAQMTTYGAQTRMFVPQPHIQSPSPHAMASGPLIRWPQMQVQMQMQMQMHPSAQQQQVQQQQPQQHAVINQHQHQPQLHQQRTKQQKQKQVQQSKQQLHEQHNEHAQKVYPKRHRLSPGAPLQRAGVEACVTSATHSSALARAQLDELHEQMETETEQEKENEK